MDGRYCCLGCTSRGSDRAQGKTQGRAKVRRFQVTRLANHPNRQSCRLIVRTGKDRNAFSLLNTGKGTKQSKAKPGKAGNSRGKQDEGGFGGSGSGCGGGLVEDRNQMYRSRDKVLLREEGGNAQGENKSL